jgi:transcriptional regulator with XRE-family HTH domain
MVADNNMLNEFGFTAGARLARAREAMGLSIADVAMQTRIRDRHLLALETGDFAALPGRTYIVGFARSYARVVGLNEGEIAAAMTSDYLGRTSQAEAPPAPAFAPGDPARVPSSRYAWLAAAIVAIVGIGGFAYWQTSNSPTATLPSLIPADRPVVVASAPAVTAVAPASVGPVVFTALGDAVWVEFYDGAGHQLLQKQLVKGETYTVPADAQDPKIRTGRPDLLAITIGGQAVPKLAEQQQLVKDVAVSAPALLARATPVAAASAASALPASGAPIPGAMAPVPAVAPTVHKAARTYRPHVGTPTNDGAASAAPVAVVSPSTVAQ